MKRNAVVLIMQEGSRRCVCVFLGRKAHTHTHTRAIICAQNNAKYKQQKSTSHYFGPPPPSIVIALPIRVVCYLTYLQCFRRCRCMQN